MLITVWPRGEAADLLTLVNGHFVSPIVMFTCWVVPAMWLVSWQEVWVLARGLSVDQPIRLSQRS